MSVSAAIRLLIVDDHPVVRDGLRGIFAAEDGFDVVGEAQDGAEAIARASELKPHVVLMDLRMPAMGGVEAIARLRETVPTARVLVLTTYDADHDVLPAIEAGATGYLLKDAPRDQLVGAVRAAYRGEPVLSPSVAGRLMGRVRLPQDALSQRELEVLRLVAGGRGQPRGGCPAVRERGHNQDAPAAHLQQARRPGSGSRRGGSVPAQAAPMTGSGGFSEPASQIAQ